MEQLFCKSRAYENELDEDSVVNDILISNECPRAVFNKMESAANNNRDGNNTRSFLDYRSQAPVQARPRSHFIILILAVSVHAGFIGYLFSWRPPTLQRAVVDDNVLEVTFIDRASDAELLEVDPRSAADKHKNKKTLSRRQLARPNTQTTKVSRSAEEIQDSTLRLSLDIDEWNVAPVIVPKNPLQRQFIAMPGRVEPFVKGIEFRKQLSPQQRLAMVGKLFGAVEYDACKEARNRMVSGQSQMHDLDVEADLRSIERHCRP